MAKKVFVFDMDGVLVRSEQEWLEGEADRFEKMLGKEVADKMGVTVGVSVGEIYDQAKALGSTISKKDYDRQFNETAIRVYRRASITAGSDKLVAYLKKNGWQLALVSSSPVSWINQVLGRLSWKDQLDLVLSVNEHPELKPKPAPDGYLYILKTLGAEAKESLALEDSNPGILSAKAAGLFTIGYTEHLVEGYRQIEADTKAGSMEEVIRILDAKKH